MNKHFVEKPFVFYNKHLYSHQKPYKPSNYIQIPSTKCTNLGSYTWLAFLCVFVFLYIYNFKHNQQYIPSTRPVVNLLEKRPCNTDPCQIPLGCLQLLLMHRLLELLLARSWVVLAADTGCILLGVLLSLLENK